MLKLQKSHSEAEKAMDGGQGRVHKWLENLDRNNGEM